MDIRVNDILVMKKSHPCGEKRWLVLRTGADSAPWSGRRPPTANVGGFSFPAADAAERTAGWGKLAAKGGHGCDRLFPEEGVYFCHTGWR